jgi:hypothetical protein
VRSPLFGAGGGGLDGRRLRLSLRPAAERLQPELGQLLGPDAVVLLETLAQDGRQTLAIAEGGPEPLREVLLPGRQRRLLAGQVLGLAQDARQERTARLQVGDVVGVGLQLLTLTRIRRNLGHLVGSGGA